MNRTPIRATLIAAVSWVVCAAVAQEESGPPALDLSWNTIDGGGGAASGAAAFELVGTIGQPDAGSALSGDGFELTGGFWPGAGEEPIETCPADVTGNDTVNVDDLLAVIGSWGICPPPPSDCPADIAPPPSGNGAVNVDDLLTVINAWGNCP